LEFAKPPDLSLLKDELAAQASGKLRLDQPKGGHKLLTSAATACGLVRALFQLLAAEKIAHTMTRAEAADSYDLKRNLGADFIPLLLRQLH
jgi:hypothetical protein